MTIGSQVNILGTRGIPASHGGFETFAERLALYLVSRGHTVRVYCQSEVDIDLSGRDDSWHGVHRTFFGTRRKGAVGTMEFDFACVRHVLGQPGIDLVLGYNTAVFNLLQRMHGRTVYMNMDGVEWKRAKWSLPARGWLWANEFIGARLATRAIADHPEIGTHILRRCRRGCVMIPYGADVVGAESAEPVRTLGLEPRKYFISVARIEPENSIREIVRAFGQADTGMHLVVLGNFDAENAYHRAVQQAADSTTIFPGAIYDGRWLRSLRFHARAYLHGHQVGGTNPSLVEALGAGNPVIAHDNPFNRWTAGRGQRYFSDMDSCAEHIRVLAQDDLLTYRARMDARERHAEAFRWQSVLTQYESLLLGPEQAVAQVAAE